MQRSSPRDLPAGSCVMKIPVVSFGNFNDLQRKNRLGKAYVQTKKKKQHSVLLMNKVSLSVLFVCVWMCAFGWSRSIAHKQ